MKTRVRKTAIVNRDPYCISISLGKAHYEALEKILSIAHSEMSEEERLAVFWRRYITRSLVIRTAIETLAAKVINVKDLAELLRHSGLMGP